MALIRGADPTRYGTLIAELSNHFAHDRDDYPKDLTLAYSLLLTTARPPTLVPETLEGMTTTRLSEDNRYRRRQRIPRQ